ncbi:MAG TPA: hypothetical protein VI141_09155 [Acidimicrobiia bacterium]
MSSEANNTDSAPLRRLEVTHREALALLSALEISPFDDEVLTQKLLNLVYSRRPNHDRSRRVNRDFAYHRRPSLSDD